MVKLIINEIKINQSWGPRAKLNTRVYIWPKGESILENLANRHDRPHDAWAHEVMPSVYGKLGLDTNVFKMKWNTKAGCTMCPCSPGFVIKDGVRGREVSVSISYEKVEDEVSNQ